MIVFCLPLLTSCLEQGLDQTFSTDLQPWASPWFPLFQKTASPPNIHWQDSPWLVNLEVTSNSVSLPTASDSSSHWSCVFISFFTGTDILSLLPMLPATSNLLTSLLYTVNFLLMHFINCKSVRILFKNKKSLEHPLTEVHTLWLGILC